MSASLIFDSAPIGSIVSWSDGTPRPPNRFNKKLTAWETRNGHGRLIRKEPPRTVGKHDLQASFTVHLGDFGGGSVVLIKMHRTFSLATNLVFTVIARPSAGSIRIFDRAGENRELLHLATDRATADAWLTAHLYPNAVLEVVTDDVASNSPGRSP